MHCTIGKHACRVKELSPGAPASFCFSIACRYGHTAFKSARWTGGYHTAASTRLGNVHWVMRVVHIAFRLCDYVMLMPCLSMQQLEMHHLLTGSLMLHDIPVHLPYQGTQAAKG